ncbi:MAG TPA: M13 family metallopeptidase N-terminal domain-containing protein, partial [Sphingomicrobium sp.]
MAVEQPAAPAPKPQYGTFGFDTAGMDKAVVPGDDFFDYANGAWDKSTQIPADKASYGMFNVLDDLSRERTRGIIEEQAKDSNSRIGNAYQSFMDEQAIAAKGLTPFDPWLNQIRSAKSKKDLPALYAEADRLAISGPYRLFVAQDRKAPDTYILSMGQSGLGMPDRDYYLSTDPKQVETK